MHRTEPSLRIIIVDDFDHRFGFASVFLSDGAHTHDANIADVVVSHLRLKECVKNFAWHNFGAIYRYRVRVKKSQIRECLQLCECARITQYFELIRLELSFKSPRRGRGSASD